MPNSIKNNSPEKRANGRIAALSSYRLSGCAFASFPASPARGKARRKRAVLDERFGHASVQRPQGHLVWVHAASVGETKSVLPLIDDLLTAYPDRHILLTTGTVTSAEIVAAHQNRQGGIAIVSFINMRRSTAAHGLNDFSLIGGHKPPFGWKAKYGPTRFSPAPRKTSNRS